jgi:N-acetylglucosaminyl-diphospho-decaprenol L-rhamnosyltransferase
VTTPSRPRVLAAIVNYRRPDLTLATAASLLTVADEVDVRTIVVDNASGGNDIETLRTELPDGIGLLQLTENHGYGAAGNAALSLARSENIDFVWLLNNDIAFEPGCLTRLVQALDQSPDLGACAPVVVEQDRPDIILSSGIDVRLSLGRASHRRWGLSVRDLPPESEAVDAVEASALLMRVSAADACGGFDEGYFMYWEDLDWCLRARAGGWALASVSTARIRHRLSQSTVPLARIEYMIRNRIRTVRVHGSAATQVTFMAYMVLGWLPVYALTRLLPKYGPMKAAKAAVQPLAWNIRDAAHRGHWRLKSADQQIGLSEDGSPTPRFRSAARRPSRTR